MKTWIKGSSYEVAFWRSLYRNKKARAGLLSWSNYGEELTLPGFDAAGFLKELTEMHPIVLDVGCGMSYCTGNKVDGKDVNIHYVDPLAVYYNKILDDFKVKLPRVEFGMIEYLSAFYPESNVSLIIVQNALDHSSNPIKGIMECVKALKPGGVLYLKHYINEAEYENYRGFHKYNVDEQDGKLVIWNKTERHDVESMLTGWATLTTRQVMANERVFVTSVITKLAEPPVSIVQEKADIAQLCSEIMSISLEMNSASSMMKLHVKKVLYNMVQFFMRMLSSDVRMRLKMILSKTKRDKTLAH